MKKPLTYHEMLRQFRSKARCRHSQRQAIRLGVLLAPLLGPTDAHRLGVAWEHALGPEGPGELDALVDEFLARGPGESGPTLQDPSA